MVIGTDCIDRSEVSQKYRMIVAMFDTGIHEIFNTGLLQMYKFVSNNICSNG